MFGALNVKTQYSLLDSIVKLELFIDAKEKNYSYIGICDFSVLSSFMYLKKLALKYQIKVIYGLEVNIVYQNEVYPLCLYAYI